MKCVVGIVLVSSGCSASHRTGVAVLFRLEVDEFSVGGFVFFWFLASLRNLALSLTRSSSGSASGGSFDLIDDCIKHFKTILVINTPRQRRQNLMSVESNQN